MLARRFCKCVTSERLHLGRLSWTGHKAFLFHEWYILVWCRHLWVLRRARTKWTSCGTLKWPIEMQYCCENEWVERVAVDIILFGFTSRVWLWSICFNPTRGLGAMEHHSESEMFFNAKRSPGTPLKPSKSINVKSFVQDITAALLKVYQTLIWMKLNVNCECCVCVLHVYRGEIKLRVCYAESEPTVILLNIKKLLRKNLKPIARRVPIKQPALFWIFVFAMNHTEVF